MCKPKLKSQCLWNQRLHGADSSSGSEIQRGEVSVKVLVESFCPAVPSVTQDLCCLCHC